MDLFSGQLQFDNLPESTYQHYGTESFLTYCGRCGAPLTGEGYCDACNKEEEARLAAWNGQKG